MTMILDMDELGARLRKVDMLLMSLLHRRMDLALEVGRRKLIEPDKKLRKIFNPGRESVRLKGVHKWAKAHGMNPHFAETVLYTIIGESCKQQMIQMQNGAVSAKDDQAQTPKTLRKNLLILTRKWAKTYDADYKTAFFATCAYREFEEEVLAQEMSRLSDKKVLLDLGCATGGLAIRFAEKFDRVVGYDISPHMIAEANSKIVSVKSAGVSFKVADLENGIPEPDHSVSMVVMNLGTASDIQEIRKVIKEISRVLRPHGRFFLSFYNHEALVYNWDFMPWQVGLAAVINTYKNCLDVQVGNKTLSVYARPYSVDEVTEMIRGGISVSQIVTYPTISPLLPTDLFENPQVQESIIAIDKEMSTGNQGAYIIVTGHKLG